MSAKFYGWKKQWLKRKWIENPSRSDSSLTAATVKKKEKSCRIFDFKSSWRMASQSEIVNCKFLLTYADFSEFLNFHGNFEENIENIIRY